MCLYLESTGSLDLCSKILREVYMSEADTQSQKVATTREIHQSVSRGLVQTCKTIHNLASEQIT